MTLRTTAFRPGVTKRRHTHDIFIVDLRWVIEKYSPTKKFGWWGYVADSVLRDFVRRFTIQNIISAEFVEHYDYPKEDLIWTVIEAHFPCGTGAFEENPDTTLAFELLVDELTADVFHYLNERMSRMEIKTNPMDMLFEKWISPTAAIFVDKNFDPSLEKFGERFGKF